MTIEEALKTAIEFEHKVTETYRSGIEKLELAAAKKIFETLADEEEGHVAYLESRLTEWQKTGHVTPEKLDTVVPPKDLIEQNVAKLQEKVEDKRVATTEEVGILQKALNMELEASAFYNRLVSQLDAEGKALFQRFMEIEDGHVAIVQAELDAVTGLGYWFDFQEWKFQDG